MDDLITALFDLRPEIRYVALYRDGSLATRQRPDLADASAAESDRYEELLVNPALLTLARQRGDIDVGGLDYLVVRYGAVFQLVMPIAGGHASIAFDPRANPIEHAQRIADVLRGAGAS
jgi:hypothetical protein